MAMLDWDEWYETGILSIDHEHHTLFDALNRMHEAIAADEGEAKIRRALDFLVEYTATHFKDEEARLMTIGFPGLAEHQAEHAHLLDQVAEYKAAYDADPSTIRANQLALFLVEWIVRHINEMDVRYIDDMKAKGVR
jgi:hemerythrin